MKAAERRRSVEALALGIVATAAMMVAVGYFVAFEMNLASKVEVNLASEVTTLTTSANETRTHRLADGSVVSLGELSSLRLDRENPRHVQLLAGRALFMIVKDAATPFVVSTDFADTTTEGGKFSIVMGVRMELAVLQGVVEVTGPGLPAMTVKEGRRYWIDGRLDRIVAERAPGGMPIGPPVPRLPTDPSRA